MTRLDRTIISLLVAGLWFVAGTNLLSSKSGYAFIVNATEITGLEGFVKKVVQRCTVNFQGKVYFLRETEMKYGLRISEDVETEDKKPDLHIVPESGDRGMYPDGNGDLICG